MGYIGVAHSTDAGDPSGRPYAHQRKEFRTGDRHVHLTNANSTADVVGASRWLAPPVANATRVMSQPTGTTVAHSNAQPRPRGANPASLGAIVAQFKSVTAKRINAHRGTPREPVWHRNYYEHIIRDSGSVPRIREYINLNPVRWEFDPENPQATQPDPEDV